MDKKTKERIMYLEQQIAAGNRIDGYSLEGHKKELKKLKENKDPRKCGCGKTNDPDGNCDGSHNQ
jgi:CDGSH-type Zn-finger protein|tara:strand:+ start:703 stop:897 length:195 start_codon:yes stop_codon:yes gene_type:complete